MYENLKKKYGQNFLIDKNILSKIANLISKKNLKILEIGPGDGKLTDQIINLKPAELTLIEVDKDLIRNLSIKYSNFKFVDIINENILDLKDIDKFELVISNLPYNISSQIIVKLSLLSKPPSKLILMFQKEFAQRLIDKKINSINSLINCFYEIKLNFHVGKNCFRPIPKVDSSVLTFSLKKEFLIEKDEIEKFILFKRNLFSHKRKTLRKLLKNYKLKIDFDLNLRVEDLELLTLIKIFRATNQ